MKSAVLLLVTIALLLCEVHGAVQMRWCYKGNAEKKKCEDLKNVIPSVAKAAGVPDVTSKCVDGTDAEGCLKLIKENSADLTGLDGGEMLPAETYVMPIVSETHAGTGIKYYAVAVVKKSNPNINLKNLNGTKTCHTGARKSAGWVLPVGYMLSKKIMPSGPCNEVRDFLAAGKFFSESCVPNVAKYNESGNLTGNLCALCKKNCSSADDYAGYAGAFRCMNDGQGDVAFVKHTTVQSAGVNTADFEYLCKDGTRNAIGQHEKCNLGYSPAHAVVARKGDSQVANYVKVLLKLNQLYGTTQTNYTGFQLFNSTKYGGKDLLFKDSATALNNIDEKTIRAYLGDYYDDYKALTGCKDPTTKPKPSPTPTSKSSPLSVQNIMVALSMIVAVLVAGM